MDEKKNAWLQVRIAVEDRDCLARACEERGESISHVLRCVSWLLCDRGFDFLESPDFGPELARMLSVSDRS